MAAKSLITVERLREVLAYDQETGNFTWLKRTAPRANRISPGDIAGKGTSNGYHTIRVDGVNYRAHRLAWFYIYGIWPSGDLDHIDGVRSHNWIANLRPATRSQNMQNAKRYPRNKSGFKGVTWNKQRNKWKVRIHVNKKDVHLGFYREPREAHAAYCEAARKYFGEFARPE